jgi:NAD(P)-dependent dehydrogenase (short-subunit alcohol dehydrogenase family)
MGDIPDGGGRCTPSGGAGIPKEDTMEGMGDPTPLRGRTALVTGGTTGIGRATARLLARRGVRVMIFGRSDDHLEQAIADIGGEGEVHGTLADVSRPADVRRVFE